MSLLKNAFTICLLVYCFCLSAQQPKLILPIGHTLGINSAQFSPDGKKIVTTSRDNTAKIWDVATGSLFADLKGHSKGIHLAQFSSDGKEVLTYSGESVAKLWDAVSGDLIAD